MSEQYRVSYAQNREDMLLEGFFGTLENGFYVDVGASDPEHFSVTKHFYDKGWSGINVEPIKRLYKKLQSERPRDINLNMGISDTEGEMQFREYAGDGLSTFSTKIQEDYQAHPNYATSKYKEYPVKTNSLKRIFEQNGVKTIDFMKVDVEGFEHSVLASNDWKKYRPSVICIEANHVNEDWRPILQEAHYSLAFFDGINEYYISDEYRRNHEPFSFEQTILGKPPVVTPPIKNSLVELDRHQIEITNMHSRIATLEAEQRHIHRLKPSLVNFLHAVDNFIVYLLDKAFNRKPQPISRDDHKLSTNSKTTKSDLLSEIHTYDATFLYDDGEPRTTIFRIVLYIYKLPIRIVKKIARTIL